MSWRALLGMSLLLGCGDGGSGSTDSPDNDTPRCVPSEDYFEPIPECTPDTCQLPPSPPESPGDPVVPGTFVVSHLAFGEYAWTDDPENDVRWKVAYDLDGFASRRLGPGRCLFDTLCPYRRAVVETPLGVDNNFADVVVPVFSGAGILPFEENVNAILGSDASLLIRVDEAGEGNTAVGVSRVYRTEENWTVERADVVNDRVEQPKSVDAEAFIRGGLLVAHPSGPVSIPLPYKPDGLWVWLSVHHPVITGRVTDTGIVEGRLAGVVLLEDVLRTMELVFQPALTNCLRHDPTARSLADMMADGSAGSEEDTCDAISLGVAFEAVPASAAGVVDQAPNPSNACD